MVPELRGELEELREKRESALEKCRVEKETIRVSAQKLYSELMEFHNIADPDVKAEDFIPKTPSTNEISFAATGSNSSEGKPGKALLVTERRAWSMGTVQQCHAMLRGNFVMASPLLRLWGAMANSFMDNDTANS